MASLFDDIVLRRPKEGNKVDMRPLWKLKLTDDEFRELQSFLKTGVKLKYPDWFRQYPRECLLFFAEYWKRFYDGGKHSVRDVMRCLTEDTDQDYERSFYRAARNGASLLRIEIYEGEGDRRRTLDSILYQGGLPMRLICQSDREGFQNWTAFTKRLVRGFIELSDYQLGLGQVATNLQSIRQFADQLYRGIATNDPKAMPFHCPDENHPWFRALSELKESERRKNQESTPFSIDWVIELDDHRQRGRILGRVRIPSKLSQSFLQEQGAEESNYSTVRVMTDGLVRASIEYQQGYARMSRDILLPMPTSDSALSVDFEERMVATGSFDYSRPHLFSFNGRQSNGMLRGEKANRIKESEMMLFIPDDWTLETEEELERSSYVFSDESISIVSVPTGYSKDLRLTDKEGNTVVFNGIPIGETQLIYTPLFSELVLSPTLCDASELQRCHILTETQEGLLRQTRHIEFEGPEKGRWSSTPSLGRIKARGIGTDKEISEPVSLCNVGKDFHIDVLDADSTQASIRISWPHGQVTCLENNSAYSIRDNSWTVRKENLLHSVAVRFRLTVSGEPSSFMLKIRAPFKQMQITDEFGEEVDGRVYVPLCDYDKYSYNIFGVNSARIRVESEKFRVNGLNKKLKISAGDELTDTLPRKIYRHGSIAALFGSNGKMRQLLENQRGTIINSNVKATLRTTEGGGKSIELNIREYPFKLRWNQEDNIFILKDPDERERPFRHSLLVFRLKEPRVAPVSILPDEEDKLRLQDDLIPEHDLLIVGNIPGRVLPVLYNRSDLDHNPREIAAIIEQEICSAYIGSDIWNDSLDWFNQAALYGIPYSSLLQLKAISLHKETLIAFLFQCILRYGPEERGDMIERLMQFSRDLSFKWFWLIPVLSQGLFSILMSKIDITNERLIRMLVPPAISTLPLEYLNQIAPNMILDKMNQLENVLVELIKKSLRDSHKAINNDIYEVACGWIDKKGKYEGGKLETKYDWFPDFSSYLGNTIEEFEPYKEKHRPASENWLISRVKAFSDYMTEGKIDLFAMSHDARRSLCLCYEVAPYQFIREAHNDMLQKNNTKKTTSKKR